MLYTVKEVSQKTGLSPYTIRYYLREGLFPSIERDSNGTRLFAKIDIETLYMIECIQKILNNFLSVAQHCRQIIQNAPTYTCPGRLQRNL